MMSIKTLVARIRQSRIAFSDSGAPFRFQSSGHLQKKQKDSYKTRIRKALQHNWNYLTSYRQSEKHSFITQTLQKLIGNHAKRDNMTLPQEKPLLPLPQRASLRIIRRESSLQPT